MEHALERITLNTYYYILFMPHFMPYLGKDIQNYSLKLMGQSPLVLVCLIRHMGLAKFVQMMIIG